MYHDVIPWDDDIDLMVDYRDYPKLKRTFQSNLFWSKYNIHGFWDPTNEYAFHLLNQTFPDVEPAKDTKNKTKKKKIKRCHTVKIFSADQKSVGNHPWKYPCIDIFFFKQNLTHIWQLNKRQPNEIETQRMKWYTPISEFYPFHLRPYAGMWLPVPHKTMRFLKNRYHVFRCHSNEWNHQKDAYIKPENRVSVPCQNLQTAYVSINRTQSSNGTLDAVYLSKDLVYSVFIDEKYEIW
jgi:hypothetical protein